MVKKKKKTTRNQNIVTEMKNAVDGLISGLDTAEGKKSLSWKIWQ